MHSRQHLTHMGLEIAKQEDALLFHDPDYASVMFDSEDVAFYSELTFEYLDGKFKSDSAITKPFFCIALGDSSYAQDQALVTLEQAEAIAQFLLTKVAKARAIQAKEPTPAPVV